MTNAANIAGAEQSLTFTYACLVDTSTLYPQDGAVEVNSNISSLHIPLKEKVRPESVTTDTVIFSGGAYTVRAGNSHNGGYIEIDPQQPLAPDTWYTVTIKGDDPATIDDLTTPFKIENLEGVQWYVSNPDPAENNLDRQG